MFSFLGRIVSRAWPLWLAAWVALLAGLWLAAPPWDRVAQDEEFAFLPAGAPSRRAEEKFAKAFPQEAHGSNLVLVLYRSATDPAYLKRDLRFIEDDLEPGLRGIAKAEGGLAFELPPADEPLFSDTNTRPAPPPKRSIIARIRTPNAPGVGALLVSPDRKALLVVVELTTDFLSVRNWHTIAEVKDLLRTLRKQDKVPDGLDIALTGSAAIGRDHTLAQLHSARATGLLTVILVVVLLVLIYRAPLLALIPLATVYVAVEVALNILALLGQAGYFTIFQGLQIYVTILAYGAGVDYCLFLTARYREELDRGASPGDAVAAAIGGVGHALVASAATVMCGIGMMIFAQFGKFQEAGFAIPLSLLLVLCATLTFSAPLLRLAGRWAFWPRRLTPAAAPAAPRRSRLPAWLSAGELERIWDRVGRFLSRRAGTVWLVTLGCMVPFVVVAGLLRNNLSYDVIGDLPADASSTTGTRILQRHFPPGILGPTTVLLVNPHVNFAGPQGPAVVGRITDRLRAREKELGLADVRSLTAPLGLTPEAAHAFTDLDVPAESRREAVQRTAREYYLTDLGTRTRIGTRLDLVLGHSPFSRRSMRLLSRAEEAIHDALPADLRDDTRLYALGVTASVRDLEAVMQQDRMRIDWLVLASVLVILVLLLRRLWVSIYLLLSVVLSYYTTLGVTFAVFWLLDPHGFTGLDWKVAIFLFTILVAVGEDYNIFLMTRIDEETKRLGPIRGVTEALDRTGPVISSCGIIMAGTFASLLAGTLAEMKQLGFALAFGVLLDTFVVRPVLVPAFLILWRRGRSKETSAPPAQTDPGGIGG